MRSFLLSLLAFSWSVYGFENAGHYHFRLGEFHATVISDGVAAFPALPLYAPKAKPSAVKESKLAHFQDPDKIDLYANPIYVDTGKNKILFDVGAGDSMGPSFGKTYDNLLRAGIDPLKIDSIFITHGHLDHIGGLTDPKSGISRYPNAIIYLSQEEWKYWAEDETDLSMLDIPQGFKDIFVLTAKKNLRALKNQTRPFKLGTQEIIPGISAMENTWGHTPGHVVYRIRSSGEELLVLGDSMFNEAFDISHPNWQTAFDWNPKKAEKVRLKLLQDSTQRRTLLHIYHISFPAIGYLKKAAKFFNWVPSPYQFNQTTGVK